MPGRDQLLPSWDAEPGGEPGRAPAPGGPRVRSVSEVARALRDRVRSDDGLRDLWVEGEVSRYTVSTAGHAYFTLKDPHAQLACVWFREQRARSAFRPEPGLAVLARGRLDVFEAQGTVQLYVESVEPAGVGNLATQFEQTKARLAAEGLFDAARKRRLPQRPAVIALVTSPTGAVRHDVCTVVARRWPLARVLLVPCQVQGQAAPASIVAALAALEAHVAAEAAAGRGADAPAVTILARGGGSPEDLWAFSDERVVRAVAAHTLPLVAGIGHETDVSLADFAADVRAATPSAAAELVVPDRAQALGEGRALVRRAGGAAGRTVAAARRALDAEARVLARVEPATALAASRERAGLALDRASRAVAARIAAERAAVAALGAAPARLAGERLSGASAGLASLAASLAALDPGATLRRGYALVRRDADGALVRDPLDAPAGEALRIRLASGELAARSAGPAGGPGGGA